MTNKEFIGFLILFVLVFGSFGVYAIRKDDSRRQVCENSGGVYFSPRGDNLCIKKEYVIVIK